ncbi:MAG: hypothetical protein AAGL99_18335, partial [Pseudomonadota bacterium]
GDAAWKLLVARNRIPSDIADKLKPTWDFKIAPYGDAEYKPPRDAEEGFEPSLRNHWYGRFVSTQ